MSDEMPLPPPPDVGGYVLDGDKPFAISAEQNVALCRSTGAEPDPEGSAHPIYYYIATQLGMGTTVAGLCAACGFNVEDGPMIVGSSLKLHAPLKIETPYRVTGEILSLVRKRSRKLGVMDLLEYRLALHDRDVKILEATNSWVLPRKELA